jgi:hypothetical protein
MSTATRTYTGLPSCKFYAARFREGQARPVGEMNRAEAQGEVMRRIKCYQHEHPDAGVKAARGAILDDDQDLRQAAYPLPEEAKPKDESQPARAARHQDQLAAQLIREGKAKSYAQAIKMADEMAPAVAAKARNFAGSIRSPNDIEDKLRSITEADLIELLVTIPGKGDLVNWRGVLREWATLQIPRYPVGSAPKGPAVDAVNELTERIWQAVRQERLRRRGFAD